MNKLIKETLLPLLLKFYYFFIKNEEITPCDDEHYSAVLSFDDEDYDCTVTVITYKTMMISLLSIFKLYSYNKMYRVTMYPSKKPELMTNAEYPNVGWRILENTEHTIYSLLWYHYYKYYS